MTIKVHIERLTLEGLPLKQRHRSHLQATVERELARLLTDHRSTPEFNTDRTVASVQGRSIHVAEHAGPETLGEQIAAAVHGGLQSRP